MTGDGESEPDSRSPLAMDGHVTTDGAAILAGHPALLGCPPNATASNRRGAVPKPAVAIGGIDVSAQKISCEAWDRFTSDWTRDLAEGYGRTLIPSSPKQGRWRWSSAAFSLRWLRNQV